MKRVLIAVVVAVLASACGRVEKAPVHVVMIGIDGWSAAEFREADMPFVKSLMEEGAWTLDKRCVIPTASAINWMTLFSGVQPEYHGYTQWNSTAPDFTQAAGIKTIFRLEREQHPSSDILVTYQWDVIRSLVDSSAVTTILPFDQTEAGDFEEVDYAADYFLQKSPRLSLIYFGTLDETGHEYGWKSDQYRAYLTHIDSVVKGVAEAASSMGDVVFVLTTDHGGLGKSHTGCYVDDVMQTPLFIWGKGIKKNHKIEGPAIQMDVTATMARILGIETPSFWTGRVLEDIFE